MSTFFKETHCRVNHQTRIWKKGCEQYPVIREPQNHGWKNDNDQLAFD